MVLARKRVVVCGFAQTAIHKGCRGNHVSPVRHLADMEQRPMFPSVLHPADGEADSAQASSRAAISVILTSSLVKWERRGDSFGLVLGVGSGRWKGNMG